jgi:hypothetical protein
MLTTTGGTLISVDLDQFLMRDTVSDLNVSSPMFAVLRISATRSPSLDTLEMPNFDRTGKSLAMRH